MHRLIGLALALMLSGCGATGLSPADAPSRAPSQSAESGLASPDASPSPTTEADPDGTFVFVPAVIDCPNGCPTTSVSEALAAPGMPGIPLLVDGAILIEPDGSAWLCEYVTGMSPPRCGGARLLFENIELYGPSLEAMGLQDLNGLRWLESVTISGEVTPRP